jgi:TolA-binding protein
MERGLAHQAATQRTQRSHDKEGGTMKQQQLEKLCIPKLKDRIRQLQSRIKAMQALADQDKITQGECNRATIGYERDLKPLEKALRKKTGDTLRANPFIEALSKIKLKGNRK